jgi:hypothetical protein
MPFDSHRACAKGQWTSAFPLLWVQLVKWHLGGLQGLARFGLGWAAGIVRFSHGVDLAIGGGGRRGCPGVACGDPLEKRMLCSLVAPRGPDRLLCNQKVHALTACVKWVSIGRVYWHTCWHTPGHWCTVRLAIVTQ